LPIEHRTQYFTGGVDADEERLVLNSAYNYKVKRAFSQFYRHDTHITLPLFRSSQSEHPGSSIV
jgi:hypothetical protein